MTMTHKVWIVYLLSKLVVVLVVLNCNHTFYSLIPFQIHYSNFSGVIRPQNCTISKGGYLPLFPVKNFNKSAINYFESQNYFPHFFYITKINTIFVL